VKIAVSGKGGVGKTTLAACLARVYARRGFRVLCVDADPAASLAPALGVSKERIAQIRPITEMRELIEERTGAKPGTYGGFFSLNPDVDDLPDAFAIDADGVRLLVTGGLKDAASGCYCPENELLKVLLLHIFTERDEYVVLDMEAGIEHLTRGTTQAVDAMVVVVEPGMRSLRLALSIEQMAHDLGIEHVFYVANKVATDEQAAVIRTALAGKPLLGILPRSDRVALADLNDVGVDRAAPELLDAVDAIADRIELGIASGSASLRPEVT
jgi:CO dehydrogenase maturation factor